MAKVVAPLLSMDARGQIGKSHVFSNWRGVQYARRYTVPANPQTQAQEATRNAFTFSGRLWQFGGQILKAPWDLYAQGRPQTGRNRFIGSNTSPLRGSMDLTGLIGSIGAQGGFPPAAMNGVAGTTAGEVTATLTAPTIPTGWTIERGLFWSIADQPSPFEIDDVPQEVEIAASPYEAAFSGYETGATVIMTGWFEFVRDDGLAAHGPSQTVSAPAM